MRTLLVVLAVVCFLFAVIDFLGMFLNYDLTGTSASPIIAGGVGSILMAINEAIAKRQNSKN